MTGGSKCDIVHVYLRGTFWLTQQVVIYVCMSVLGGSDSEDFILL